VLREAVINGKVVLQTALDSCKDYIRIDDVVGLLLRVAFEGKERLYNLASGVNVTHRELLEVIQDVTGCELEVLPDAQAVTFPPIETKLIRSEFGFVPTKIMDDLAEIARAYQVYFRTAPAREAAPVARPGQTA
jgi:nucleoside-diphosphate-sugar epimerase